MEEYPEELKLIPKKVIGLVNLPEYHEKLEKKLKQSLKNSTILKFADESSLKKSKGECRRDYTGYIPEGLLKRGWITKHQEEIPSVLVLILTLDLGQSFIVEQERLVNRIEEVRNRVRGYRMPRFVAVILSNDSLPVSSTFDEFVRNLRQEAQLENKQIHFCENSNIDSPLTLQRLDRIIELQSNKYYNDNLNRVRKLKNVVKKELQPYLYLRHRFKVGFLNEIIGNPVKALKYYQQCYEGIKSVVMPKFKDREIHFVADFVNFKICLILQREGKMQDCIEQFLVHMSWSRKKNNFEREYEYYKNMYKQYRMFSEIMENCVRSGVGLKLKQSYQNPGFYFQLASTYAKLRQKSSQNLIPAYEEMAIQIYPKKGDEFTQSDEILVCNRGYVGKEVLYLSDEEMKAIGNHSPNNEHLRSAAVEVFFPHSQTILMMLKKAYDYFKNAKYKGFRKTLLFLLSRMADEYFFQRKFKETKEALMKIKRSYFHDQWFHILVPIMKKLLFCSKHMKMEREFVEISLFLLSNKFPLVTKEEKKEILEKLYSYFEDSKILPSTEEKLLLEKETEEEEEEEENEEKKEEEGKEQEQQEQQQEGIVLDMLQNKLLIGLKMNFNQPYCVVFDHVNFNIMFQSTLNLPLEFHQLLIHFNDSQYDIQQNEKIVLLPNREETILSFNLQLKEKKDIFVQEIQLIRNNDPKGKKKSLILKWTIQKNLRALLVNYDPREEVGGIFPDRPIIRVTPPKSEIEMSFEFSSPALVEEFKPIVLVIHSKKEHILKGILKVGSLLRSVSVYNHKMENTPFLNVDDEILPDSEKKILLYIKSAISGQIKLKFSFEYSTTLYPEMLSSKEITLEAEYPILSDFSLMGLRPSSSLNTMRVGGSSTSRKISYRQKIEQGVPMPRMKIDNQKGRMSRTSEMFFNKALDESLAISDVLFVSTEPFLLTLTLKCKKTIHLLQIDFLEDQDVSFIDCLTEKTIKVAENTLMPIFRDGEEKEKETTKTIVEEGGSSKSALYPGDQYSVSFAFRLKKIPMHDVTNVDIGSVRLTCKREVMERGDQEEVEKEYKPFSFQFLLPKIRMMNVPISVFLDELKEDREYKTGVPIHIHLTVVNNSEAVQTININIRDNKHFLMSGIKEIHFELFPYGKRVFEYQLLPVSSGLLILPKFVVDSCDSSFIVTSNELWSVFVKEK